MAFLGAAPFFTAWLFLIRFIMYRLEQFKRAGKGILDYFEDNIGKIEIKGKSGRMEKVYFEIENSRRKQWKDKQIKESRKFFLQTSEVASSREKLESFINFCEDTIFEVSNFFARPIKVNIMIIIVLQMEHIAKITDSETSMRMAQAEVHLSKHYPSSSSSMRYECNYLEAINTMYTLFCILLDSQYLVGGLTGLT